MLHTGKYLGVFDRHRIIAVAGVHVSSDKHRVAVLGNVTTRPDYRGRGLATRLTYTLTRELVNENKMVCLNVKADNTPAITCYEQLGFVTEHQYREALFELK
jgi:predicted GNAT family acetyltransferase